MRVLFLFLITCTPVLTINESAALILARGGSKGIRLKNLQSVGSVSLLARAIRTAKIAGLNVTVSTDHPLIALEAIKNGAEVFLRSRISATDWAPSIWGAAEFLSNRPEVQILVLIQATSPFIRSTRIRDAVKKIEYPVPCDCVFAATRSFKLRWKDLDGFVIPINFEPEARPRRQDWSGELAETGALYISRRHLIEKGYFQNYNCTVIEVSSLESLEVDNYLDLEIANALLRSNLVET